MVKDAWGVYVTGEDGTTYLDFSSQLVNTNIGHQHPAVVRAIQEQAATLCTIAPQHGYVSRYRAAELILDRSFDGAAKVFFTNGGTEAMEHAVRMARLHTGRHKVLAAYRSYHGATATSINLTGRPATLAERQRHCGRRALLRPVPLPLDVPRHDRGRRSASAPSRTSRDDPVRGPDADRRDRPRDDPRHRGHHGAAAGLPAGRARDLRPLRHRLHRRRGHVRLRSHRRVVRLPAARRQARPRRPSPRASTPATSRWAASSSTRRSARRSTTASTPGASRTRATRWRARRRSPPSRRWRTRGSSRTPGASATRCCARDLAELARAPPRSSATCAASACSSRSSS